jgi:hypothetical protein
LRCDCISIGSCYAKHRRLNRARASHIVWRLVICVNRLTWKTFPHPVHIPLAHPSPFRTLRNIPRRVATRRRVCTHSKFHRHMLPSPYVPNNRRDERALLSREIAGGRGRQGAFWGRVVTSTHSAFALGQLRRLRCRHTFPHRAADLVYTAPWICHSTGPL